MIKKLKRLFMLMVLIGIFVLPQQVFAEEVNDSSYNSNGIRFSAEIRPNVVITIDKTITRFYSNVSDIPETYFYTEYNYGTWWSGTLHLESIVKSGSSYKATYSGKLIGTT